MIASLCRGREVGRGQEALELDDLATYGIATRGHVLCHLLK